MSMHNLSIDYLTVTIKPLRKSIEDASVAQMLQLLEDTFSIGDTMTNFQLCGRSRHYVAIYRFNDISVKLPSEERLYNEGLCLEMTSNGFAHWVSGLPAGRTVRDVFRDFRALSVCGFKCNVPRLDIAMDDIARGLEKPLLHMSVIRSKWANHEFCSRSQANSTDSKLDFCSPDEGFFKVGRLSQRKKRGIVGETVYWGNRRSPLYIRFYDKKAEQLQAGKTVDSTINSWVRCEYEYHDKKAMAVMTLFVENDYEVFLEKYKRLVMGHLRFINPDQKNRSRCSSCGWWVEFLGCLTGDKLLLPAKKTVQFNRTFRWLMDKVSPSLWAVMACMGDENFLKKIHECGRGNIKSRHVQLMEDYLDAGAVTNDDENFWFDLLCLMEDDTEQVRKRLRKDASYINYIPAGLDRRHWLQMVFSEGAIT